MSERIPIGPFQERYLLLRERGETADSLAIRAGYTRPRGDTSRLHRDLGLKADGPRFRQGVTPKVALRLCEALDLDPVDVGL